MARAELDEGLKVGTESERARGTHTGHKQGLTF